MELTYDSICIDSGETVLDTADSPATSCGVTIQSVPTMEDHSTNVTLSAIDSSEESRCLSPVDKVTRMRGEFLLFNIKKLLLYCLI